MRKRANALAPRRNPTQKSRVGTVCRHEGRGARDHSHCFLSAMGRAHLLHVVESYTHITRRGCFETRCCFFRTASCSENPSQARAATERSSSPRILRERPRSPPAAAPRVFLRNNTESSPPAQALARRASGESQKSRAVAVRSASPRPRVIVVLFLAFSACALRVWVVGKTWRVFTTDNGS